MAKTLTNLAKYHSGDYFGARPNGFFSCEIEDSGYSKFSSEKIEFEKYISQSGISSGQYSTFLSHEGLQILNPTGESLISNLEDYTKDELISDYTDYLYCSNSGLNLSFDSINLYQIDLKNDSNQGLYFLQNETNIISYLTTGIVFYSDFDINYNSTKFLDFNGPSGYLRIPSGINLIIDKIFSNTSILGSNYYINLNSGLYSYTDSKLSMDWKNKILSSGWSETGNPVYNYDITNKLYVDTTGNYLLNKINIISGNLVATGLYLNNKIDLDSGHLITTGQYLLNLEIIDSGNLIFTGNYLQSAIDIVSGDLVTDMANLVTTGQSLLDADSSIRDDLVSTGIYIENEIFNSSQYVLNKISVNRYWRLFIGI